LTCQRCGDVVEKPKGYKRKYCDECRPVVAREKNRIDQQNSRVRRILAEPD
jgi:hypothetical protein